VLLEFLAFFAGSGALMRRTAAQTVRGLESLRNVEVLPLTRQVFLTGLALYEARPDKAYSLADCISMQVMRERGLTEALTSDHHFAQEENFDNETVTGGRRPASYR
jgi:predicted nucleic acid-binding protein